MMPIACQPAKLTANEQYKQQAAVKQMDKLLAKLAQGKKYSTLSVADRQMLQSEGFANDLIDNLAFFTERPAADLKDKQHDALVLGFTYAAFDPSMYACPSILQALQVSHNGRCAYCESQLEHTGQGSINHFRPAWGVKNQQSDWNRKAYYALAYKPENLLLSCMSCSAHKANQFPVHGEQAPQIPVKQEQPLLVNPYTDDPRRFIRFCPITAQAYAYDEFSQFCVDFYAVNEEQVEQLIWQNPRYITQHIREVAKLRTPQFSEAYSDWKKTDEARKNLPKGQTSIDLLGLNRPALLRARLQHIQYLQALLISQQHAEKSSADSIQQYLKNVQTVPEATNSFRSLTVDVIQSWQLEKQAPEQQYKALLRSLSESHDTVKPAIETLSPQLSSSLQYMVLGNELTLENKRRIVHLHSSDYLYGSDRRVETVFLPIDWEKDFENVVKVHTGKMTWEASFAELSQTDPVALQHLFANNEVWAEGQYTALA